MIRIVGDADRGESCFQQRVRKRIVATATDEQRSIGRAVQYIPLKGERVGIVGGVEEQIVIGVQRAQRDPV
jgi:hypothetical protein